MMSEICLDTVYIIFLGHFDAVLVFVLFKFMGDAWGMYFDAAHHVICFHFVFAFFVISGVFARKVCFFVIFIVLPSFVLAFFVTVIAEE